MTVNENLTRRERQVLLLVRDGLTNREIAEKLDIALNTVARHLSRIYSILGARSRSEAIVSAIRWKMIPLEDENG